MAGARSASLFWSRGKTPREYRGRAFCQGPGVETPEAESGLGLDFRCLQRVTSCTAYVHVAVFSIFMQSMVKFTLDVSI